MWWTVKKLLGFVAQWIERLSPEQKVVGSIPIKPTSMAFGYPPEAFCIFGACKAGAGVGNGKAGDAGSLGSWKNRPVWRER